MFEKRAINAASSSVNRQNKNSGWGELGASSFQFLVKDL